MGLFSFVKNAGAKLFGSKKATEEAKKRAEAEARAEHEAQLAIDLETEIRNSNLAIDDLYVEVSGDTVILRGSSTSLEDKEKAILICGNVTGIAEVDDQVELIASVEENPADENNSRSLTESTFHTVVSGDSLSKIAKKYYGNAMKYPVIFEANRPMLKSPDLIYPGQVLRIPELTA